MTFPTLVQVRGESHYHITIIWFKSSNISSEIDLCAALGSWDMLKYIFWITYYLQGVLLKILIDISLSLSHSISLWHNDFLLESSQLSLDIILMKEIRVYEVDVWSSESGGNEVWLWKFDLYFEDKDYFPHFQIQVVHMIISREVGGGMKRKRLKWNLLMYNLIYWDILGVD